MVNSVKNSFGRDLVILCFLGTEEARQAIAVLWSRNGVTLSSKVSHRSVVQCLCLSSVRSETRRDRMTFC